MTLVLVEQRTEEALREALFANRAIAYFGHTLAGKEEYLKSFFEATVEIEFYNKTKNGNRYILKNTCDVPFLMQAKRGPAFTIPANGETIVTLPKNVSKEFIVKNLFTKGAENLTVSLDLKK